mmetsp:Transcript_36424/g.74775  ORF Transcript_36424/g.74775 Transcript_36424/m.74775 type:complete len:99 (-) Transcript_36424:557-853(-)
MYVHFIVKRVVTLPSPSRASHGSRLLKSVSILFLLQGLLVLLHLFHTTAANEANACVKAEQCCVARQGEQRNPSMFRVQGIHRDPIGEIILRFLNGAT